MLASECPDKVVIPQICTRILKLHQSKSDINIFSNDCAVLKEVILLPNYAL